MIKILFLFLFVYILYKAFNFFIKIGIFKSRKFDSNDSIDVDKTNLKKTARSKDLGEFVDYEDLE